MLKETPMDFKVLHFNTFTLSPIKAKWVERWSKPITTSFIGPMMWVSFPQDGNTQLGVYTLVFKNV
jgi:hypothetical protein